MKIIENLTSVSHQNEIEDALKSYFFPWHYNEGTTSGSSPPNIYDNINVYGQFTNVFKDDNGSNHFYPLVYPLIVLAEKELGLELANKVYRVKANFLLADTSSPENTYHYPHIDVKLAPNERHLRSTTLLYYVNDSIGDTVIFNEKNPISKNLTEMERISPKKGRAVFFDSSHLHCSTPPKTNRYVINIVFKL